MPDNTKDNELPTEEELQKLLTKLANPDDILTQNQNILEQYLNSKKLSTTTNTNQRTITITIVGATNSGKSTLLNALIGNQFSIVSPKPQTTRGTFKGILTIEDLQMIFIDTPGVFDSPNKRNNPNQLEDKILKEAWKQIKGSSHIIYVISAKDGIDEINNKIIKHFIQVEKTPLIVINKIDAVPQAQIAELITSLQEQKLSDQIVLVSASKNFGLDHITSHFSKLQLDDTNSTTGFTFDKAQQTDCSLEFLTAENIRKQILDHCMQEVPYSLTVEAEEHTVKQDTKNPALHIFCVPIIITVTKESHKKIIIGKNAQMIKTVRIEAQKALTKLLGLKANQIHINTFVKVRDNALDNQEYYKFLGMDI